MELELPSADLGDDFVDALLESYEVGDSSEDSLVESWGDYLIAFVERADSEGVRDVCRGVLRRLSDESPQAAVDVVEAGVVAPDGAAPDAEVSNASVLDGYSSVFGPPDNPYVNTSLLGSGATAKVYRCTQGDHVFASKVIDFSGIRLQPNFDEQRARMTREMDILADLRHPRIVSLYATHETRNHLYLVLELVEGGELFDHMGREGFLSEAVTRGVFLQLVEALTYIHFKGVVHRDLKLENILVSSRPPHDPLEVKVTDFGHSKLIGLSNAHTQQCGTSQYWAPEVAVAPTAAGYDFSVDLWSLGVVLYIMLEGAYPFSGPKIAEQIRRAEVPFGADSRASTSARDVVTQLIRREPSSRLSLDGCRRHQWAAAAAEGAEQQAPGRGGKGVKGRRAQGGRGKG